MDDQPAKPSKGFARSALELLGLAESPMTTRREARVNLVYAFVMMAVVGFTSGIPFGRRMVILAVTAVVVFVLVSVISRFLPEPRRRSDIPPGSH